MLSVFQDVMFHSRMNLLKSGFCILKNLTFIKHKAGVQSREEHVKIGIMATQRARILRRVLKRLSEKRRGMPATVQRLKLCQVARGFQAREHEKKEIRNPNKYSFTPFFVKIYH